MNRHFNKLTLNCCNNILGEKKNHMVQRKHSIGQWDSTWCLQLYWRVPSELVVACKGFVNFKEFLKGCIHNWGT